MKRTVLVLLTSLAMIAATFLIGLFFNAIFPQLQQEYANEHIYRSMNDPLMYAFFIQPFFLSAALIWCWEKIKGMFSGKIFTDAIRISTLYFFIAVIPGMLMTLSSFKVSVLAVLAWTISSLLQVFVAAVIFVRFNK
jgi:hypothetical protein